MKTISKKTEYAEITEVADCIWVLDNMLDPELCEFMIQKFELDPRKTPGITAGGRSDTKKSTDLGISPLSDWKTEDTILNKSLSSGFDQLKKVCGIDPEAIDLGRILNYDTGYQIQRTNPGEYYKWHYEGFSTISNSSMRSLTYTWYLNDEGIEGGTTGFMKQDVQVEPKAGRLIFFSTNWSHTHCGFPVTAGSKYLITGWAYHG